MVELIQLRRKGLSETRMLNLHDKAIKPENVLNLHDKAIKPKNDANHDINHVHVQIIPFLSEEARGFPTPPHEQHRTEAVCSLRVLTILAFDTDQI